MGKHVAFTSEFGLDLIAEVGGKGANLGELTRAGFRTPPAFSIKSKAFDSFLEANNLNGPISVIALSIDYKQMSDVEQKSAQIRKMISSAVLPENIAAEIRDAYMQLQDGSDPPLVAVRSSVGTRDLSRSSFPGQMDTYHNIISAEEVLSRVKECWASMWTSRAVCTMHAKGIDYRMIIIAPLVQLMVPSETAGVIFTVNPLTGNVKELVIDAGYGLGEAVVSGKITPDNYIICKEKREIKAVKAGYKKFKMELDCKKGYGNCWVELSEEEAVIECLQPEQIKEIAGLGVEVEKHYRCPQDVEWAYAGGKLYILQTRRI
ncbi:MAG: PEP/pyruvate-binding domain-containing protein, partial [Bacteroidetes bacterium]|nr:PEP/pyruvate-binding domain-containing protein [Bacteroidota bacterium]